MVVGRQRTIYQKWRFRAEFDGIGSAVFAKVGPLEFASEVVKYNDGGAMIPHKELGMVEFSPITCERGSTENDLLYEWALAASNVAADRGANPADYKRNGSIYQLDRAGNIVKTFRIYGAMPTKFKAGEWDNSANEAAVEELELEYDYFETESTPF